MRIRFTEDHTSQVRTYLGYHDEHTYHCLPVNATYHTYKCACGNTLENEEHAFKVSNIVDEDGNDVADGEIGEFIFENPYVRGYINLPEETATAKASGES